MVRSLAVFWKTTTFREIGMNRKTAVYYSPDIVRKRKLNSHTGKSTSFRKEVKRRPYTMRYASGTGTLL